MHSCQMQSVGSVSAVTLGTLIHIVAGMHGVTTARIPALKGRFTNFLKVPFPAVSSAGPGTRTEFWPEHVAHALVAFELVRYRVPQSAVARGVLAHAGAVEGAFGDAARRLAGGRECAPILLAVRSNALLEDAKKPELSDITIERLGDANCAETGNSSWTIDVAGLVVAAVAAARSGDEPLDAGFFAKLTDRTAPPLRRA